MEIKQIYENASMYEAKDLLDEIKSGYSIFLMNDPDIAMINGGNTQFSKDDKEDFFIFSEGQNWRDQEKTYKSKEEMLRLLQKALNHVDSDFDKYEYDTQDTNACYITIDADNE